MTTSRKSGSALLIVLGFLSFMVVSAVAFAIYMRAERMPSSALRRAVATRHLVHAALAEAIARVDDAVRGDPFPGLCARDDDFKAQENTYRDGKGDDTRVAASLYAPNTGIYLEMFTTEPGVQVYTGNFLDGKIRGKHGIAYPKQASVCLESQKYPDSPNKQQFASPYLRPGEKYTSHTAYRFTVK